MSAKILRVTVPTRIKYCVYTHSHQGTIFYVGQGDSMRPFQACRRTKAWHEYVDNIEEFQVSIMLWTNDRAEALQKERELITRYKPFVNGPSRYKVDRPSRPSRIRGVLIPVDLWKEMKEQARIERKTISQFAAEKMEIGIKKMQEIEKAEALARKSAKQKF